MADETQPSERKRGRPPAPVPRSVVSAWVPADAHDRLIRIANAREVSVSRLISNIVVTALGKPPAA